MQALRTMWLWVIEHLKFISDVFRVVKDSVRVCARCCRFCCFYFVSATIRLNETAFQFFITMVALILFINAYIFVRWYVCGIYLHGCIYIRLAQHVSIETYSSFNIHHSPFAPVSNNTIQNIIYFSQLTIIFDG